MRRTFEKGQLVRLGKLTHVLLITHIVLSVLLIVVETTILLRQVNT